MPNEVPPLAAANQDSVPLDVAPKFTEPAPQRLAGVVAVTVGATLTVIVKVIGFPTQLFKVGVTEIVATPEPEDVNEGIFPEPLAANPIAALLLVHAYVFPVEPEKVTAVDACPEHTLWFVGVVIVGAGFTVAKTAERVELQPFDVA